MKVGVFYIATSVYIEYFKKYFSKTVGNLFPYLQKEIIILADNTQIDFSLNVNNCNFHFEHIIDFPYPIINLCKFQIINEYAKKYDIDVILYFDADTIIFEKENAFWSNLMNKCLDNKNKLIISRHPHYLYNENWDFTTNYFFSYKDNSCSNLTENEYNILIKNKSYLITSFFMGYKTAVSDYSNKIYAMTHNNLNKIQWVPILSDEMYMNVINLRENLSILSEPYVIMNYCKYENGIQVNDTIWYNVMTDNKYAFINQKFDISLKNRKKDIIF